MTSLLTQQEEINKLQSELDILRGFFYYTKGYFHCNKDQRYSGITDKITETDEKLNKAKKLNVATN